MTTQTEQENVSKCTASGARAQTPRTSASPRPRAAARPISPLLLDAPTPPAATEESRPPTEKGAGQLDLGNPKVVAALNSQAAVLENVFFPAQVLAALGLEDNAHVMAARIFLARFRQDAGEAADAVEKVLLDQLAVAHLKVGELYALAAGTTNLEWKQMYQNAATRLVGSICQLVSTLGAYRALAEPRRKRVEASRAEQPRGGVSSQEGIRAPD